MHIGTRLTFICIALVFFSSCKKDPIVVDGNEAPPDATVETVVKENYVNKLYISLLGRKATAAEFDAGLVLVNQHNFSKADRRELIDFIQAKSEFFDNEFKIICANLLNESDTSEARMWINIYKQGQQSTNDKDAIAWAQMEIDRLEPFIPLVDELTAGNISFVDVHKTCINNTLYDMVNMGTQNFVTSMYQNFLFREPTDSALVNSIRMIDYDPAKYPSPFVFSQEGHSKTDFISIFFSSNEYYEGQVRAQFKRFLFREPTTEEMSGQSILYKNSKDFKALQKYILAGDEYAGLK